MPKELEDKILIASGIDGSKIIEVESQLNALNTHILQRYGNGYKGIISKLNEKENDPSSPLCPAGSDEQTTTLPGESIAGIMLEIRGRDELYKGNIADSIKVLTQAITFCPELPGPYSWRGYAFLQNKEFKKAREDMDKAVSKKPNFELPYT